MWLSSEVNEMTEDQKRRNVTIVLSKAEKEDLQKRAESMGLSMSAFIRVALNQSPLGKK